MLAFTVCTSTAFLFLARDGPVRAEGGSSSPPVWDSGMLVSLPPGIYESLEKMGVMASLCNYGFDTSSGYMAYCGSRDVDRAQCTSSWFPYDLIMGEMYDNLLHSALSTRRRNADGKPIADFIVPASSVIFVPGDLPSRLFERGYEDGCMITTPLRSRDRRSSWRFMSFAVLTGIMLMWKQMVTGTFRT